MKQLCHWLDKVKGIPFVSLFVGTIAALCFFLKKTNSFFQYDRGAIAGGEVWRIISSHFTHWSFDHFLWCTVTFIALGCICESLDRKSFVVTLVASAFIIPVISWCVDPEMYLYRGLSGLCSSVFIVGVVQVMRASYADKSRFGVIVSILAGILFSAKILFEFVMGESLFVEENNIFDPVPLVHFVGGIVGLVIVLWTAGRNGLNVRKKQPWRVVKVGL